MAEVGQQSQPLRAVRVVARLVRRYGVAALLRVVHGDIRVPHEGGEIGCVLVAERDANRCRDVHPEPVQRHRLAQCTDYPVGQVMRFAEVARRGDDREFVAA